MATGATAEMKASAEGSFWARAFYFHCTTYILYFDGKTVGKEILLWNLSSSPHVD